MQDLMARTSTDSPKTPIEIALGVDEKGMTTARKLYEFLELAKGQFSRWVKKNILDNTFAEEGTDYWGFDIIVEGNRTKDYRLTARFAKKLSMTQKNEKGEQAREYFTRVEDGAKEMVLQLQGMSPELRAVLVVDRRVTTVEQKVGHLENTMNIDYAQQKQLKNFANEVVVNALGGKNSKAYTYTDEDGRKISKRCFSRFWNDFNDYFGINAYANLPRVKFQDALEYINHWQPPVNMQLEIGRINRMAGD